MLSKEWEKKHRALRAGDVVLFHSGYSDLYYKPLARGGECFVESALRKDTPGWPAPTPETMTYLADRGVMTLGLDGVFSLDAFERRWTADLSNDVGNLVSRVKR